MDEKELINKYAAKVLIDEEADFPDWLKIDNSDFLPAKHSALFAIMEECVEKNERLVIISNDDTRIDMIVAFDKELKKNHIVIIKNDMVVSQLAINEFKDFENIIVDENGTEYLLTEEIDDYVYCTSDGYLVLKNNSECSNISNSLNVFHKYSNENFGLLMPRNFKKEKLISFYSMKDSALFDNLRLLKKILVSNNGIIPEKILLFSDHTFLVTKNSKNCDFSKEINFSFKILFGLDKKEISKEQVVDVIINSLVKEKNISDNFLIDLLEKIFVYDDSAMFKIFKYYVAMC